MDTALAGKRDRLRRAALTLPSRYPFDPDRQWREFARLLAELPPEEQASWMSIGDSDPALFSTGNLLFPETGPVMRAVVQEMPDSPGVWPRLPPNERQQIWAEHGHAVQSMYDLPADSGWFRRWAGAENRELISSDWDRAVHSLGTSVLVNSQLGEPLLRESVPPEADLLGPPRVWDQLSHLVGHIADLGWVILETRTEPELAMLLVGPGREGIARRLAAKLSSDGIGHVSIEPVGNTIRWTQTGKLPSLDARP